MRYDGFLYDKNHEGLGKMKKLFVLMGLFVPLPLMAGITDYCILNSGTCYWCATYTGEQGGYCRDQYAGCWSTTNPEVSVFLGGSATGQHNGLGETGTFVCTLDGFCYESCSHVQGRWTLWRDALNDMKQRMVASVINGTLRGTGTDAPPGIMEIRGNMEMSLV